ncbi:MAG: PPOX class F420-dependent oxidoreductase [Chloroflexi bacterium]|nr:PPOX class F420-dependent oxidoreductase [Chloroflexota bacterium]
MTAFPHLQGQQYMSLTTFRKNGQPVPTPVWFAQVGDKLYVYTSNLSGKAKRLSHTTRVTVAPCTASGKVIGDVQEAEARIMRPDEEHTALTAINRKYGMVKRAIDLLNRVTRLLRRDTSGSKAIYLEIVAA